MIHSPSQHVPDAHPSAEATQPGPAPGAVAGPAIAPASPPDSFRLHVGVPEISSIIGQWRSLYDRCPWATPYQSPEWAMAFATAPGVDRCFAASAWRSGMLVGLLPLASRRVGPLRLWSPLGTGLGGMLHPLADVADTPTISGLVRHAMHQGRATRILAEDVAPENLSGAAWLTAAEASRVGFTRVTRNPCWVADLAPSLDEFLAANKSSKSRQTLRRQVRVTRRDARIEIQRFAGQSIDQRVLARVAAIQERSWMLRRGAAVLGQPWYQRLLGSLAQSGCLHAAILRADDEDAAFTLGMVAHQRYFLGWLAFDLRFEKLGVGRALLVDTIDSCCALGLREFDFGQGDAEYKRFWGTRSYAVERVLFTRGPVGRLARVALPIVDRLRRARRRTTLPPPVEAAARDE